MDTGRASGSVRRIADPDANANSFTDAYTVTKSDADWRVAQ